MANKFLFSVLWQVLRQGVFVAPRTRMLHSPIPPEAFQWFAVFKREPLPVLDLWRVVNEGDEFLQDVRTLLATHSYRRAKTWEIYPI